MKNWEAFEEEVLNITKAGGVIAVVNGEVRNCDDVACEDCSLTKYDSICDRAHILFLYDDYVAPVKLTPEEKQLCNLFDGGFIARDRDGKLYWYPEKPHRAGERWFCEDLGVIWLDKSFPQCKFEFVSWNEESWEVPHD